MIAQSQQTMAEAWFNKVSLKTITRREKCNSFSEFEKKPISFITLSVYDSQPFQMIITNAN